MVLNVTFLYPRISPFFIQLQINKLLSEKKVLSVFLIPHSFSVTFCTLWLSPFFILLQINTLVWKKIMRETAKREPVGQGSPTSFWNQGSRGTGSPNSYY
jgi:hypothetical protein